MIFKLRGHLSYDGAKRGERYATMEMAEPYPHEALLTFYGNEGREDDDALNEDLYPLWGPLVDVVCTQDQYGHLISSPADVTLASGIEAATADKTTKIGLAEGESPTGNAGDARKEPQ